MRRLNNRAYQILCREIQKCSGDDPLSQIEQKLVLEVLEKLHSQSGSPATSEELGKLVFPTYPEFSEKALSAAAKANRSLGIWGQIRLAVLVLIGAGMMLVGTGGAIGLALILLSSTESESVASSASASTPTDFASMSNEEHFQAATVLVDQAEQLVNPVKTPADLALSEQKLNEAKPHIDELPVSSTVYSSGTYSRRSKRRSKRYSQQTTYYDYSVSNDPDEQFALIRSRFEQLQAKVTELKAEQARNSTLIKGAQVFALAAAKTGQNPPHSAAEWQEIESLWQKAISRLEEIPGENPGYVEAQKLLATYQVNLGTVQARLQAEQESVEALERAQNYIESLVANTPKDAVYLDRNYTISQLQTIIDELEKVKNGTTAYPEAHRLLLLAQNKLKQLHS